MRRICYHVAVSLDGFIARADGSIKGFPEEGDHVEDYLSSLADYDTVIMGRKTYEFGYEFGLKPGARAYPHMEHWIFSKTLNIGTGDGVHVVRKAWLEKIQELKAGKGSDIYLCGGSIFAGWLLAQGWIDRLRLKLNPVAFGKGLPLFSGTQDGVSRFTLTDMKRYKSSVVLLDYKGVATT